MCKRLAVSVSVLVMVLTGIASAVEIRVDFGYGDVMLGWTQWAATSGSKTIDGITFTLSNGGLNNGPKIRDWQAGSNDQLTRDALSEEDAGSGGWYQVEISGLTEGASYRMRSYHNNCWKLGSFPTTSVSMKLNGTEVDTANLSEQQAYTSAGVCEYTFTASAGSDTFKWDFAQTAFFNGFELASRAPLLKFVATESGGFEYVSPAQLEVILKNAEVGQTYTVDYAAVGGTATKGNDYTLEPGTLTFNPGETSKNISVGIIDDGLDEDDETIIVELSNPTGPDALLGWITQHTYTIIDPRPDVGFDRDSGRNAENAGLVKIPVSLSFAAIQTVTVDYAVSDGTATGGGVDYTLEPGTLTFSPGETSKPISIALVDDGVDEENETVVITLSNISASGLPASITEYTLTLLDAGSVDLKIDFALPFWDGSEDHRDWEGVPIPGTLKDGWIPWCAGRWGDMYGHGAVAMENVAGTGISTMISTVYGGLTAVKVCGMCMESLNGGWPTGSPIHDPICNSWVQVEDHPENPGGDIVMALYNLPAGEYELYSYHNNFECHRNTPACCDLIANPQPLMPSITALSLDGLIDRYAAWEWWPRWMDPRSEFINCMPGASWDHPVGSIFGNNVTTTLAAYDVPVQQVTSDDDLVPSLIKFRTDGSAVHIVYESGCCVHDGIRPQRMGGRAILNAFELRFVGTGGCACLGDVSDTGGFGDPDGKVDIGDLNALLMAMLEAYPEGDDTGLYALSRGSLPCGTDCSDTGGFGAPDGKVDIGDLNALLMTMLEAYPAGDPTGIYEVPCL